MRRFTAHLSPRWSAALHEALLSLSKVDPRTGRVVEMRYFAGLSVEETAEALQISPETAKRDWKMAKAWLLRELNGGEGRRQQVSAGQVHVRSS
jgi:RNA polymerase sigma factor (sigma-70 family)